MNRRFWIFCLGALLFLPLVNGACDSFFKEGDSSCPRVESPLFSFSVSGVDASNVSNISADVYEKTLPANTVPVEASGLTITNEQPLMGPGVYVLDIAMEMVSGQEISVSKEFIFDPSIPLPPSVPIITQNDDTSLEISGKAVPGTNVEAEINDGSTITSSTDEDGNFTMDLTLVEGINHVVFTTTRNGKASQSVHRIIDVAPGGREENKDAAVTGISVGDLESQNPNAVLDTNYVSSQRAFYVSGQLQGSNLDGAPVVVGGRRVLADDAGNFGAMVLLNEGSNSITLESQGTTETITATYIRPETLTVQSLDIPALTQSEQVTVSGRTNENMPVRLWRNGVFVEEITAPSDSFSVDVSGLNPGRNLIRLELPNGKSLSRSVYYDTQAPQVSLVSPEKIGEDGMVVFRIADDTGVDRSTISLSVGDDLTYDMTGVEKVVGNYYRFDLSELSSGTHSFQLDVSDRLSKSVSISGNIQKQGGITSLPEVSIPEGEQIGNHLFVREGENTLVFNPTRYVAFEGIYLDGKEVVDYQIRRNGNVEVTSTFTKTRGTLNLSYENTDGEAYTQDFIYHTDAKGPELSLYRVDQVATPTGERVRVSGRVDDEFFDWDSLAFNGNGSFQRYGNHFEALVKVETPGLSNLEVTGYDVVGNGFENGQLGALLRGDGSAVEPSYDAEAGAELTGVFQNIGVHPFLELEGIDGNEQVGAYSPETFNLALTQLQGLRQVRLKGEERSGQDFLHEGDFHVDGTRPEISFQEGVDTTKVIADGTYSPVDSLSITKNGASVSSSLCSDVSLNTMERCQEFFTTDGDEIAVNVTDLAGHTKSASYTVTGTKDTPTDEEPYLEFTFQNNVRQTTKSEETIEGVIDTNLIVENVTANGEDVCSFTNTNFICTVSLPNTGEHTFGINVSTNESLSLTKSYTLNRLGPESLEVAIEGLSGSDIFKIGNDYYTSVYNFTLQGNVSESAAVTLLKDNFEQVLGEQDGRFTYEISIEDEVSGLTRKTVELELRAEKETRSTTSDIVNVIFSQFPEPLAEVFVR